MLLLFVVGVIFAQAVCPPEAREIPGLSLIGSGNLLLIVLALMPLVFYTRFQHRHRVTGRTGLE